MQSKRLRKHDQALMTQNFNDFNNELIREYTSPLDWSKESSTSYSESPCSAYYTFFFCFLYIIIFVKFKFLFYMHIHNHIRVSELESEFCWVGLGCPTLIVQPQCGFDLG